MADDIAHWLEDLGFVPIAMLIAAKARDFTVRVECWK